MPFDILDNFASINSLYFLTNFQHLALCTASNKCFRKHILLRIVLLTMKVVRVNRLELTTAACELTLGPHYVQLSRTRRQVEKSKSENYHHQAVLFFG
jgi:hypothetical protein